MARVLRSAMAAMLASSAVAAPAAPSLNFTFDAGFGSWMVLQRAPSQAAVYGYLPLGTTGAVVVNVTLTPSAGGTPTTFTASLNVTQQPYGDGWGARPCSKASCPPYDMEGFTPWAEPLPSWKVLLPPMAAGGDFELTATCAGCAGAPGPISLTNVTFGDVWLCSGQVRARRARAVSRDLAPPHHDHHR